MSASSTDSFAARIDDYRARVDRHMDQWLERASLDGISLPDAMRYATLAGGKRTRPLLVYASAELCDVAVEQADAVATAIEFIHTYSLIHDDLPAMDDDALCRGQPTTHIAYDEATAILAGDALLTLAFQVLGEDSALPDTARGALVAELAIAAGAVGMVGGQALDMAFENNQPSQSQVEDMFRRKTGRLIKAAILMPLHLSERLDTTQRQTLTQFADNAGLSFQIQDDVLDVTADTATLGKDQGSDERNEKASYPSMFGLDVARARADQLATEAHQALASLGEGVEGLAWLCDFIVKRSH